MSVSFPTILGESCTAQGKQQHQPLSRVRLFATPQTAAHQAPLSMGILVIVTTVLLAALLWVIDFAFQNLMSGIYTL